MTNEYDVEIARIGAALRMIEMCNNQVSEAEPDSILSNAVSYLKRQFVERIVPSSLQNQQDAYGDVVAGSTRCQKLRPARGSVKVKDAIRCVREVDHEGECEFDASLFKPER